MHGPTHRAARSRACVASKMFRLAKRSWRKTNHVMIVGDGARRFAVAEGFEEMNSSRALAKNLARVEGKSSFNWRPGIDSPEWRNISAIFDGDEKQIAYAERVIAHPPPGTIPCMAVDSNGDISHDDDFRLSWKFRPRGGFARSLGRLLRRQ